MKEDTERDTERDTEKTRVVFRKIEGEVTAIFPDTPTGVGLCSSYTHVGQHSECSIRWIDPNSIPLIDECGDLINELQELGYNLLFSQN